MLLDHTSLQALSISTITVTGTSFWYDHSLVRYEGTQKKVMHMKKDTVSMRMSPVDGLTETQQRCNVFRRTTRRRFLRTSGWSLVFRGEKEQKLPENLPETKSLGFVLLGKTPTNSASSTSLRYAARSTRSTSPLSTSACGSGVRSTAQAGIMRSPTAIDGRRET